MPLKEDWATGQTVNPADLNAIANQVNDNVTAIAGKAASSHTHTATAISDSTAIGRTVLTAADATAVRTAIGAVNAAAVTAAVNAVLDGAPGALDTLKELADAINDDANFAATVTTALAGKQPSDATLTALAGITTAANKLIYATGSDTFTTTDLTGYARTLLASADAAAARAAINVADRASTQRYGSGAPSSGLGFDGDTYTDYTAEKKYTKTAGTWAVTYDTTVSKETVLTGGTWATTAGTLTSDTADSMTEKKLVTTLNTMCVVSYNLAAGVDMTNKMLRWPIRMDSLDNHGSFSGEISISDTSGYTGRYVVNVLSKDMFRAGEVEAFTFCPSACFVSGTPNLASIRYFKIQFIDNNVTQRTAYLGTPVLVG